MIYKGENEINKITLNDSDKTAIITEVNRNPKKIDMIVLQKKVNSKKELVKYEIELKGLSMNEV